MLNAMLDQSASDERVRSLDGRALDVNSDGALSPHRRTDGAQRHAARRTDEVADQIGGGPLPAPARATVPALAVDGPGGGPGQLPFVRSIDGTDNNPRHEDWGAADEQLLRDTTVEYADGAVSARR